MRLFEEFFLQEARNFLYHISPYLKTFRHIRILMRLVYFCSHDEVDSIRITENFHQTSRCIVLPGRSVSARLKHVSNCSERDYSLRHKVRTFHRGKRRNVRVEVAHVDGDRTVELA